MSRPTHGDHRVVTGRTAEIEDDIAERYSSGPYRLDNNGLRQSQEDHIVQIQVCVWRLRLGPRWKRPEDVFTVQDHQVIAFSEDDQARRRSKPADNVR